MRQWKTNISSQRQRHTGSVFSQPHEPEERPQFSRPCYTPEVGFNRQDSIDAIGEATLLEYMMGSISKSRMRSNLLLPASDIMWDEDVDMTSSKMRLHKGNGIFGAPPKLVTGPKLTRSLATTPVEGVLYRRASYKYDADHRTSLSFRKACSSGCYSRADDMMVSSMECEAGFPLLRPIRQP
jgi:hypothetical protein